MWKKGKCVSANDAQEDHKCDTVLTNKTTQISIFMFNVQCNIFVDG